MNMMSTDFIAQCYTFLVLIPTALVNFYLLLLICRQKWKGRGLEGSIIGLMAVLDIVYSVGMLLSYIIEDYRDLSNSIGNACDWSGPLLAITMHNSVALLSVLSIVRYECIVHQVRRPLLFWIIIISIPLITITTLAVVPTFYDGYVLMPGNLSCHVWSENYDHFRSPIQYFFSINILVSLITVSFCYLSIAHQHKKAITKKLPQSNVPDEYSHSIIVISSMYPTVSETQDLSSLKITPMHHQHQSVKNRIIITIVIYILCHLPECYLEQREMIFSIPRSALENSICTHFRTAYALINALVILFLHSHTRRESKVFISACKLWLSKKWA